LVHGILVALLVGYMLIPLGDMMQRLWYDATAVLAMSSAFRGLLAHRPAHSRGWVLVLVGFTGWVVGDLIWLVETWDGTVWFPALSDAVYLGSYAVLGAGVLAMVRTRRSGSDRAAFLDAAILTTGVAVLMTVFIIEPVSRDASLSTMAKLVSSAYPVGDVFLLATFARMLTSPGARNLSYRLLLAALALTAVTDSLWNVLVAVSGDTVTDRQWLNAGWLCAYVLVSAAANRATMVLVAEPAPPTDVLPFGRRRVLAMGTGLLLPSAVLIVDGIDGGVVSWSVIAVGAAIMSLLVLLRFVDLFSVVQTQAVQLAALAHIDPLTGAANRRTWDHELSRACQAARDHDRRLSVAILDLDHFKSFNDTFGHQAGDELLLEAVTGWRAALPTDAVLARYGGEEFAILLPGHTAHEGQQVIDALRTRTPRRQTFSAGVVEWRARDADNPAALVGAADKALYRAKRAGRDTVVVATAHDVAELTHQFAADRTDASWSAPAHP
jgi:diguanylate cyclase